MESSSLLASDGGAECGPCQSLPLLHQSDAGNSRVSTEAEGAIAETVLNLPTSPPRTRGWRWGSVPRDGDGGQRKSGLMSFALPKRKRLKGPLRAARLCVLSILLPALLLTLPLYVRYRVYGRGEAFPLAASDMRLIDSHISTTWCQRQLVEANASFNAFLMPETPQVEEEPRKMTMHRSLYLDDDMKEYWGFYLLKGSSVSISACARWPGASLIVIKGHHHLKECAYIGQMSSEESDEMMVVDAESENNLTNGDVDSNARSRGRSRQVILNEKLTWNSPVPGKKTVRRLPPASRSPERSAEPATTTQPHESSSEIFEDILKRIMQMGERGQRVLERLNDRLLGDEKAERRRNEGEEKGEPKRGKQETSVSAEGALLRKIIEKMVREKGKAVQKSEGAAPGESSGGEVAGRQRMLKKGHLRKNNEEIPRDAASTEQLESRNHTKGLLEIESGLNRSQKINGYSSDEGDLKGMGELRSHGEREEKQTPDVQDGKDVDEEVKTILHRARRAILKESLDLAEEKETEATNEEWEGLEEGHVPKPDGIADDRGTFDHWDPNDRSRSEFWSSFSSSEEALLVCEGLVLYMPLTPHLSCNENDGFRKSNNKISDLSTKTDGRHGPTETTSAGGEERDNTLSYQVPANGYYFFVFNSENEVQTNFLHLHFDLRRRVYKVKNPLAECHNATHCELPLSFLSDQKVVLELPLKQGDTNHSDSLLLNGQLVKMNQTAPSNSTRASHHSSPSKDLVVKEKRPRMENGVEGGEALLWDESYVVVTTCEPRTTLYLCFIISVPLLILLFAFQ